MYSCLKYGAHTSSTFNFTEEIYDIKSWIAPHLNEFHGYSQPHCFKFLLTQDGKAVIYFDSYLDISFMVF